MPWRVWLSAATGEGVELLQQAIAEFLLQGRLSGKVRLKPGQARLRALLYETANVTAETDLPEGGWELGVEIERERFDRLQQHESLEFFEQQNQPPTLAQN